MNRYPWLDAYLLAKPGAEKDYKAEWAWLRYRVAGRLFAAVCCPGAQYGVYAGREMVILKCEPALAELFRMQYADVLPGVLQRQAALEHRLSRRRGAGRGAARHVRPVVPARGGKAPQKAAPRMTGGRSPAGRGRPAAVICGSSPAVRADAHPGKKAAAARWRGGRSICMAAAFRRGRDRGRRLPAYRARSVRR